MKVIKRDGRIQEFDIGKIQITLESVSDEISKPLTASDIKKLLASIEKAVYSRNQDEIRSSEIFEIVVEKLEKAGFHDIAAAYKKGKD